MKRLYELIVACWQISKTGYENPHTADTYERIGKAVDELIKTAKSESEKKLIRGLMLAILGYIDDEWRREKFR